MNEYHLLQPAAKEEHCNGSDTNILVNEIYQPSSLDNIPIAIDRECRFTSHLTTLSTNITHEVSQAPNQNCGHCTEYRHLGSTNNAKYGLEPSSSESELSPSPAEVAVDLEAELLSLVAEVLQDRVRESKYCQRCCHDTYSKKNGCRIGSVDPKFNPRNDCVLHRQKGNTTTGSAQRKQSACNKDQKHQSLESCDAARITRVTADCPVSRSHRFPELNVEVDLKQSHLFPGEKANTSSTFTNLSAARDGKTLLVKEKPSHQLYRESMINYTPGKYSERQKLTTVCSDQDTPLCPTAESSWESAGRDPIINPVQLTSNENHVCWEQSSNNTSACFIACDNSVHQLDKFRFCRLLPVGNYISNRKSETGIDASVINEPVAADCSDKRPYLGLPLNDPEKKINNELVTFSNLTTRGLASSENRECSLRCGCSVREENVLDGLNQTQDPRLELTDEPHQCAASIPLSLNQQQGNDTAYDNILDTSNYIRKTERQKGESQFFLSFSKPFPAGDFNEIVQTSKGSLSIFPNERFCNNERNKSPKLGRLVRVADLKEALFGHMTPTNSKNQPSFHSLSTCASPADNKDLVEPHLSYPLPYTRMESAMEQTINPLQYINDDNKTIKYQRYKHSRSCRRRCGIDGVACCFMCLPEIPLDEHNLCGHNKIGKRTSRKKHMNSRGNRYKYLPYRSAYNRLGRTYSRRNNTKIKQSGRRRRQYSRSTMTGLKRRRKSRNAGKRRRSISTCLRRRRLSKNAGNRVKRRRSTSTDSSSSRISKNAGNRAKRRRCTSTGLTRRRISKNADIRGKRRRSTSTDSSHSRISKNGGNRAKRCRSTLTDLRRRSRGSATSGRKHRNKPRSTGSRPHIRKSTFKSKVNRHRKPKGTGLYSAGGRTRQIG